MTAPATPRSAIDESALITVGTGPRGRGVFARRAIPAGAVIERCPVILLPRGEIGSGVLSHYVFLWGGEHGGQYALPTGHGLLFNHDPAHNADFRCDETRGCVEFFAIAAIAAGTEVTIDYDYRPDYLDFLGRPAWYVPRA